MAEEDVLTYLQHVVTRLKELDGEEEDDAEERELLITKAFEELKEQAVDVCSCRDGSNMVEAVMKRVTTPSLITAFFSTVEGHIVDLSFHCFGSRVLESWLMTVERHVLAKVAAGTSETATALAEQLGVKTLPKAEYSAVLKCLHTMCNELQGEANQEGGGEEEGSDGWGWIELMGDGSASHVARKLVNVLSSAASAEVAAEAAAQAGLVQPTKKKRRDQLAKVQQVPKVQTKLLLMHLGVVKALICEKRSEERRKKVQEAAFNMYGAPTMQVVLKSCQRLVESHFGGDAKERKSLRKLQSELAKATRALVQLLLGDGVRNRNAKSEKAQGLTVELGNAPAMVTHRVASHLLESIVPLLPDDTFFALYQECFHKKMVELSHHAQANFVVQQMLKNARDCPQAALMIEELLPELRVLLGSARGGVVVHLLQTAVKHETHCKELYSGLLTAVLDDAATDRASFVPKLLTFLTSGGMEPVFVDDDPHNADMNKKQRQRKKKCAKYALFSMVVQTMLLLPAEYSKLVAHSYAQLEPSVLADLCCDPAGSRIIETLLAQTAILNKLKQRLIAKHAGHWIRMAKSKSGSRCLDTIYTAANVSNKEAITKELAPAVKELKRDYFGRFAVQNCKVEQYLARAGSWKESVTGAEKKRRMFDDILNDGRDKAEEETDSDAESDVEMEESEKSEKNEEAVPEPPRKKKKGGDEVEKEKKAGAASAKEFTSSAHKEAMALLTGKAAADKKDAGAKQGSIEAVDEEMDELFGAVAAPGARKSKKKKRKEKKDKKKEQRFAGSKRKHPSTSQGRE
mmetsp:Transcript_14245/g.56067  ORF Transcript_14245/g.56067 Transcript_14245/m.56067 type:complete len:801 (+) Transcript_14245:57-2459(+)